MACPPIDGIKKQAYLMSDSMWGRGHLHRNGHPPAKGGKRGHGKCYPWFHRADGFRKAGEVR